MGEMKAYGSDAVRDRKGLMHVLDETGDSRIEWDPENDAEVAAAEKMFNATLEIEGMKAYEVSKDGTRNVSKPLKRFNPNAAKIIFTPAFAGGGK